MGENCLKTGLRLKFGVNESAIFFMKHKSVDVVLYSWHGSAICLLIADFLSSNFCRKYHQNQTWILSLGVVPWKRHSAHQHLSLIQRNQRKARKQRTIWALKLPHSIWCAWSIYCSHNAKLRNFPQNEDLANTWRRQIKKMVGWPRISAPYWMVQAGLLTPLTFTWRRLSPLAVFTSGAYLLQNGRWW